MLGEYYIRMFPRLQLQRGKDIYKLTNEVKTTEPATDNKAYKNADGNA